MSEQEHLSNQSNENSTAGAAKRRSSWESSLAAIAYINELARQPELKMRQSDRVTALSLFLATLATILCLLLHKLNGLGFQLMVLCDFFLGISLIIYVCNRLGILTALPPRQAALTWQLIQAFAFVGVFITVNLALILSLILSSISLSSIRLP
jgi:hypothetical protein